MSEPPKKVEPMPEPIPEVTATPASAATLEPIQTPETTDESMTTCEPAAADEPTPSESDGESKGVNVLYIVLPVLGAAAGFAFSYFRKKRGATNQ
jgi:hypothetical protein